MNAPVNQQESPSQNVKLDSVTPENATYDDSSGPLFSIYIAQQVAQAQKVEIWKGVANRILIFSGLFSFVVATCIAISYPNLQQDPNIITQSLLSQISQQLPNATSNDTGGISNTSIRSSFHPPWLAVFINTVWFLSLVFSLMCALLATFLRQSAHKYFHTTRHDHTPHIRTHIIPRCTHKFGIFWVVDALPFLLLVSVHLFFAGLVAYIFRASHTLAYFALAAVGFFSLSCLALTLMPLIFHDYPYYMPPVLWFSAQLIPPSVFSVLHRGAKQLYDTVGEGTVNSFRDRYKNMAKFLSEDHQFEEFVAGIPSLYASGALATRNKGDTQRTICDVLATLPRPTGFRASLPWSVIQLAQRAFTSELPKSMRQQRIRACLRALYYIPGAIRDVLAPYSVGNHYYLEVLPLLNSPESLEVMDELWDSPDDDVALSVRCAAAVVTAFMITPPRRVHNFVNPNVCFIADDIIGRQFLAKRLRVCAGADGGDVPDYAPHSDNARLHNIVRFLVDIEDMLQYLSTQWWTSENADLIRRERRALFDTRHMEEYCTGHGTFDDQQGDLRSPAFVPAAQQDLITLTLEILARDPVANAAASQRDAFRDAYTQLTQEAMVQARAQASSQALEQTLAQSQVPPGLVLEIMARTQARAADSIEMVKRALEPVAQSLWPQIHATPTSYDDDPLSSQVLEPQVVSATLANDGPVPTHARSAQTASLPPTEAVPSSQYSASLP